jgi:2-haloalkanoic acid dehalogenase type II
MRFNAVTFDAYGTLVRDEGLRLIPARIVADHALHTPADDLLRMWIDAYFEATQQAPFRTLRAIQRDVFGRVLRRCGVDADPTPYVDLFFEVTTTKVELYPEVLDVLCGLGTVRTAIVSNADHEHVAAWNFTLPVEFVLISEAAGAYKPDPRVFARAVERLGLAPDEVLHVGDSEVDDVKGAKAAGLHVAWLNRHGRARRGVASPDFEIRDLTELPRLLHDDRR